MSRLMFEDLPIDPSPLAAGNNALVLALFATTFINLTNATGSATNVISLSATTGNVDGMVVCFSNVNTTPLSVLFPHDSSSESVVTNRFRNGGAATITITQFGAVWFRWSNVTHRWQSIGKV